jgi:hypothetical protein
MLQHKAQQFVSITGPLSWDGTAPPIKNGCPSGIGKLPYAEQHLPQVRWPARQSHSPEVFMCEVNAEQDNPTPLPLVFIEATRPARARSNGKDCSSAPSVAAAWQGGAKAMHDDRIFTNANRECFNRLRVRLECRSYWTRWPLRAVGRAAHHFRAAFANRLGDGGQP